MAVQRPGQGVVVLGANEARLYLAPRPTIAAVFARPPVVVLGHAARVDLGIDRAASAEDPGLRIDDLALVGMPLRRSPQAPGEGTGRHLCKAHRQVDIGMSVLR